MVRPLILARAGLRTLARSAWPAFPRRVYANPMRLYSTPSEADSVLTRPIKSDLPQLEIDQKAVSVIWPSGAISRFHHIWLRDHCRCPVCFHEHTKQRLVDTFSIPRDIAPQKVEALAEGLVVEWPGEKPHVTRFPWDWLRRSAYVAPRRDPSQLTFRSSGIGTASQGYNKVLWGSTIEAAPPQVEFEAVMHSDEALLQWLNKIDQYGFCFVAGVPANPAETEALVRRIAFVRETHYGNFWDFTSDLAHGDTAYTDIALGAHTDTTYFTDPAGLQLFHLLAHTAKGDHKLQGRDLGGQSLFVDGFFAAKLMHDVYPEHYNVLRSTRISAHSAGDSDTLVKPLFRGNPIIQHDPVNDTLVMIRYNNSDRSTMRIPDEQVEPFYDALRCWNKILTDKQSEYWFRMRPGTAVIFDNHRVLHGRASFIGSRRLCGAYVPHDDYRSRLSVLRMQYESPEGTRGVWEDGV